MSRFKRRLLGLLVVMTIILGGGLVVYWPRRSRSDGPELEIVDNHRRIVVAAGTTTVTTRFQLNNLSDRPLVLGDLTTSCGCSTPTVDHREIRPGSSAQITLVTNPPGAGAREILCRIPYTSAGSDPQSVEARFTVIGSKPVPYMAMNPGAVRFGEVSSSGAAIRVVLETREKQTEPVWLRDARSSSPFVSVQGQMTREVDFGAGIVVRTYEYTVAFASHAPAGEYHGTVLFLPESGSDQPTYNLPFHATIAPAVSVNPAKLFASLGSSDPPPSFKLIFKAQDADRQPVIKLAPATANRFSVQTLGAPAPEWTILEVTLRERPAASGIIPLQFETSDPAIKQIDVSCYIEVEE